MVSFIIHWPNHIQKEEASVVTRRLTSPAHGVIFTVNHASHNFFFTLQQKSFYYSNKRWSKESDHSRTTNKTEFPMKIYRTLTKASSNSFWP